MCVAEAFIALGASAGTAATLANVATIGSTVLGAASAYTQSQAQQDQASYQAKVSRNNAIIADRRAESVERQGRRAARLEHLRNKHEASSMVASLAAQGVDLSSGSSIDLLESHAAGSHLEESAIVHGSRLDAHDLRVTGMNHRTQARLHQARSDSQNPLFAVGGSLLSNANRVDRKWYTAEDFA